jgi:RNA polymerase sigma-70 factor (ECF subfamily)
LDSLNEAARKVAGGDRGAFRTIVEATQQRLIRMTARILGSVPDAEDAVQRAYVRAYRALAAGKFDARSSIETWLYRIATNTAIDALRQRGRRPKTRDAAVEPSWDGAQAAHAHLALRELDAWLEVLPEEQRTALLLKCVEGLSSAEIAVALGCSEGAVEQRLVRARAALRAQLEDEGA